MAEKRKQNKEDGRIARRERKRNSPSSAVPATTLEDSDSATINRTEVLETAPPGSTEKQKKGVYSSGKKRRIKRLLDSESDKSDGSDSEKENQSFSQPDKEEEEGEQQTQPLRFDSDDDDVPLVSMGKRSRTAGSDTSPEGKRPRLMIDLGDDSADEVMSNSKRNSNKKAKLSFDSDDDSQPVPSPKKVSKPDSKRQLISDDSEEEDTEPTPKESASFPATLLTQPLDDSDSDLDDHVPLRQVLHKRKIISSDEED